MEANRWVQLLGPAPTSRVLVLLGERLSQSAELRVAFLTICDSKSNLQPHLSGVAVAARAIHASAARQLGQIPSLLPGSERRWLDILAREPTPARCVMFGAYVSGSVDRCRAFLVLYGEPTNPSGPLQAIAEAVRAIAAELRSESFEPVPPDPPSVLRGTWLQHPLRIVALATVVLLLSIGFRWYSLREGGWQYYATSVGEYRVVRLSDASIVELNTRSRMRYRSWHGVRRVELMAGQARFKVVHDQARPFAVFVGDTVVRDVGTEFTVRVWPNNNVEVMVVAGEVAVTHRPRRGLLGKLSPPAVPIDGGASVAAGVQVNDKGGRLSFQQMSAGEMEDHDAWRNGEILFGSMTLAGIAEELNRYSNRRIVIVDPAIAGTAYGGQLKLSSRDMSAALRKLEDAMERNSTPIVVTEVWSSEGVVLEIRGANAN